jgi:dihydrofolate synthase/folylpolyglutamate synthase
MALWHFREQGTTICVIETGLGGRLDATNIIQPILSVITNISLEHTQFLGNTLTAIAREKAGIIKENTPVIIGESSSETAPVFEEVSQTKQAPLIDCTNQPEIVQFQPPLLGEYQRTNLRTVIQSLIVLRAMGIQITDDHIESGLAHLFQNTGFMGRMQIIETKPLTLLDVSHNEDGIGKTLEFIQKNNQGKLHLIYGTSADKNYEKIIALFPQDANVIFCTFRNQRSLSKEAFETLNEKFITKHPVYQDIKSALKDVQETAHINDTILIFGSFFLIADFF